MPTKYQNCIYTKTRVYYKGKPTRSSALRGHPQKKAVCIRPRIVKPKKPNSAQRKVVKVRLSTRRKIICYIPGIGGPAGETHGLREYSQVMVRGGGVPDLPGIQYHLIKGPLDFGWQEAFLRVHGRSKYGIPNPNKQKNS
jgi:small subunit ribosomal protein S12